MNATRILLVEDHPVNKMLCKNILKRNGYHVETAENGLVALEFLQKNPFDLIVSDIKMPVMTGLEMTTYIRTRFPKPVCLIPIIAYSSFDTDYDRIKAKECGMNECLTKPSYPEELLLVIKRLTDQHLVLKAS
ncbi:MAG: response regulator [Bacteroidetes bacterium]|nr:response regulator [Bacteroidota bacterium]